MKLPILSSVLSLLLLVSCGASEAPAPGAQAPAKAPSAPLVEKQKTVDWCREHGVPESACTRCNAELVAKFKQQGDWCEQHALRSRSA